MHQRLSWLVLMLLFLINIDAKTDAERKKDAQDLLKTHFHQKQERKWIKKERTDSYIRYLDEQEYCDLKSSDCWHISLHVHPNEHKQFDRIYAFEYHATDKTDIKYKSGSKAFMGAVQRINGWSPSYDLVSSENVARPTCKHFCKLYGFKYTKTIIIESIKTTLSIRVDPENEDKANPGGADGEWAKWEISPSNNGAEVKIKSLKKPGKYLRFASNSVIDVKGTGGANCPFIVHKEGDFVKLESKKFPGKYLSVSSDGKSMAVGSAGDNETKMKIWRWD